MARTAQPDWVKHIRGLLKQAKEKDRDFAVFGAGSHKYNLSPPASITAIEAFEQKYGIRLPEEYRNFLLLVGNGGAGPYYGIYGVKALEKEIAENDTYDVLAEPVIYPEMTDEDWDKAADPEGRCEQEEPHPYAGILPIGSQGCTYMMGIVLRGAHQGQVVYYDEDFCGKPFFVREKGFLAWYERWLREVKAGYEIEWFGMNLDGTPEELMQQYQQTDDPKEQINIIESCYKFESLPKKQRDYYRKICSQEKNMEVRMYLVKMLVHFHVDGIVNEIDQLWEYGAIAEAISIITYEGTWEVKEKWYEKIFEKMPELHGDAFRDACYTIKGMKAYPNVNAGRLKEILARQDLDRNERSVLFYCIEHLEGREALVEHFVQYLENNREDPFFLICAVQAMRGVKDRRLQKVYVQLLDQYRSHENTKKDYEGSQMVLKNDCCLGASRPEGQLVNNLKFGLDDFGVEARRESWRLLMDNERWKRWKQENGFL